VYLLTLCNSLLRPIGHACRRRGWMRAKAECGGTVIAGGRQPLAQAA
jgi:hypothetical protein